MTPGCQEVTFVGIEYIGQSLGMLTTDRISNPTPKCKSKFKKIDFDFQNSFILLLDTIKYKKKTLQKLQQFCRNVRLLFSISQKLISLMSYV